ncbi:MULTISPECIES: helix-turn-helix transcriptional regulator [unclassified Serratia (in: enterobacteria)]
MLNIQFTLFDSDNFYQLGLRQLLQDYVHALNEYYRRSPQPMSGKFHDLNNMEIIFRSQEEGWGCARCYKSAHHTPRHRQLTVMIIDEPEAHCSAKLPAQFSICRTDPVSLVRQKLQLALERFCHQPWAVLHASSQHKCQKCRLAALSSCEKKVLKLMSTGMSASTIAGMLHRSQKTISAHKRSAMRKLNVNKSSELHRVLLSQLRLG